MGDHQQESKAYEPKIWEKVKVGDIVKIKDGEYFPCDLLLIQSSLAKNIAYVETKNLDGETNLKHK